MTTGEFSSAYDTYLNSFGADGTGIVLDEYEKSLFLTEAQNQLVVELYSGRNIKGAPFEATEELRSSLRNLIKTDTLKEDSSHKGISKNSKFFKLPKDVLFITYETATINDDDAGCSNGSDIIIIPVTQDEFDRTVHNPFRGPSKKRALRLDNCTDTLEVVCKYNISNYTIRYLSKPTPIILTDLDGVKIEDKDKVSDCILDSSMHTYILERAVELAVASRGARRRNNV